MSTPSLSFPQSLTFRIGQSQQISWTLADANGNPISGASVTASFYTDRNIRNPGTTPGTLDPNFQNVSLAEQLPTTPGTYIGSVPIAFDPAQSTFSYVVVIQAFGGPLATTSTWQVPAVVIFPENVIDLVTLDQTKSYLGIQDENTDTDGLIQFLITGFSQHVMNRTGRKTFNQVFTLSETYDGNGAQRLFLREFPILTLTSVTIGFYTVPLSTSFGVSGVYIEDSKKSIAFRTSYGAFMPPQSIYPYWFTPGQGNILVNYTAGYTYVPFDLAEACMKAVAINYKRADWIDLASKQMTGGSGSGGSTRYRDWALPPEIERVLFHYQRRAVT